MTACISSGAKEIFGRVFRSRLEDVGEKSREGKFLKGLLDDLDFMPVCAVGKRARKPRKLSKWQLCIKEERSGKPFDPKALHKLKTKYHAGACPTPEFLRKHQG